jgi:hypothetical protein
MVLFHGNKKNTYWQQLTLLLCCRSIWPISTFVLSKILVNLFLHENYFSSFRVMNLTSKCGHANMLWNVCRCCIQTCCCGSFWPRGFHVYRYLHRSKINEASLMCSVLTGSGCTFRIMFRVERSFPKLLLLSARAADRRHRQSYIWAPKDFQSLKPHHKLWTVTVK